jgi:hypothetical protein
MEEKNFEDIGRAIKQYYPDKIKSSTILTAKLEGKFLDEDKDYKELQKFLEKFKMAIHQECNNEDNNTYSNLKIMGYYNNQDLAAVEYKYADNMSSLKFPGLSDRTINDAFGYNDDATFESKYGFEKGQINKIFKRYLKDVIFESIPQKNVKLFHDTEYEGIKCDSINFIINGSTLNAVYKALSNEIRKDEDIRKIVKGIMEYM